jgi:ATP-dependent DNA helicase DinG
MIEEELKQIVRTAYRSYAEKSEGFRQRSGQLQMIGSISSSMAEVHEGDERPEDYMTPICCVEGPTGTGKTTSYLLSAIPVARARGKKLVISTATVALQTQLIEDVQSVQSKSGLDFKYVLVKGRKRYCCVQRLERFASQPAQEFVSESAHEKNTKIAKGILGSFIKNKWDGDFDSLESSIDGAIMAQITTDSSGCLGRKCSKYSVCPYYKARSKMCDADVIIANHDLVLTSLNYESTLLPKPNETIFVFDEAHHLPDKALSHGGAQHLLSSALDSLETVAKKLRLVSSIIPSGNQDRIPEGTERTARDLKSAIKEFQSILDMSQKLQSKGEGRDVIWRFEFGRVDNGLRPGVEKIERLSKSICRDLNKNLDAVKDLLRLKVLSVETAEKVIPDLMTLISRWDNIHRVWYLFHLEDREGQPPLARWIAAKDRKGMPDYLIAASAISAAGMLNRLIWKEAAGVVLTSATLTAIGTFDRFSEKSGLMFQGCVKYLKICSPFNYQTNSLLEIPAIRSEPTDRDAHTADIVKWLDENIDIHTSSLMLFTSNKQMREVYQSVKKDISSRVLMQGEMPKGAIVAEHKKRIDSEQGSIIFGVDSFAEGVDLKGDYLKHLLIAKLPFTMPTDPVHQAISEWIESQGRNPFTFLAVPDASIKLIQAVGRLIRTESDYGKVTIFDRRLLTRKYGQQMMGDLPPMSLSIEG